MRNRRVFAKIIFLFATLVCFIPVTNANPGDENTLMLAKQNACLGCHAINKKIVGPSFQAVAEKYKSDPNAQVFLINKISKGGSGSWGVVPMPANTKLSNADLTALSAWILRGAPSGN